MPQHVDKDLLRQQFQRAAASYEAQALAQRQAADELLSLLALHGRGPFRRVLEIGCGSGLLTRRLLARVSSIEELTLNDLTPALPACPPACSARLRLLPGDIETLPLPGPFDLIISSSALHWLHDLDSLLKKLSTHLSPGGSLAFSLYGPDNLREIKALTGLGLRYSSLATVAAMLRDSGLAVLHSSEEAAVLHFASPQDILRHLRQTGVNALSREPWSRARLERFCAEYRARFSASGGVALTYHPMYCIAKRLP
uniref:malonyl-ACP O-methyltransferase BioC n=1 Tax=Candidatus Electronema sp. TaxID=2698783 RepID=UPI00405766C6